MHLYYLAYICYIGIEMASKSGNSSTTVFIIDQQPLFRQGIRSSLSGMHDIQVVGEEEVDERVLPIIETSPPDVILLDVNPPSLTGVALCRDIKRHLPSVAIVLLSNQVDDEQLFQAIKTQASACISKDVSPDELAQTIRRCARGEHPINETLVGRPRVTEEVLRQFQDLSMEREISPFISPLTAKETEILDYMAEGYLNKQIADVLGVTEQTVKNHVTSILRKLNVNARTQAVVLAIRKGLITVTRE